MMNAKKAIIKLLGGLMIALCFAGCTSSKKVSGEDVQVFDTKNQVVEKSKEIVIDNSNVNVNVVFKPREGNDIEAYLHGKMMLEKEAKQPSVNIATEGDKVTVKVDKDTKLDEAIKQSSLILDVYVPNIYKGKVFVKSTSGKVTMNIPKELEYELNAKTASGEIKNTLPINVEGKDNKKELKGKFKSGVTKINVESAEGAIEFNKAE